MVNSSRIQQNLKNGINSVLMTQTTVDPKIKSCLESLAMPIGKAIADAVNEALNKPQS